MDDSGHVFIAMAAGKRITVQRCTRLHQGSSDVRFHALVHHQVGNGADIADRRLRRKLSQREFFEFLAGYRARHRPHVQDLSQQVEIDLGFSGGVHRFRKQGDHADQVMVDGKLHAQRTRHGAALEHLPAHVPTAGHADGANPER